MSKAITPKEVTAQKESSIPEYVFEAFNELIAMHYNGSSACFTQDAVMALILKKMGKKPTDQGARQHIYLNHWLDVEDIYRKKGWKVEYDKPAYCETYDANFTFSKKRVCR